VIEMETHPAQPGKMRVYHQLLREQKPKRVILVTSCIIHAALASFPALCAGNQIYSRPVLFCLCPRRLVAYRACRIAEYVKLLGYWARYGVCPF